MHMQLHLASDYARPITAVKLDCRRLSPVNRPNKTWIFSGITAILHFPCVRRDFDLVFYGDRLVTLDIYARSRITSRTREPLIPPIRFLGDENM